MKGHKMQNVGNEKKYSASQVSKMYRLEATKQTLINAEERGVIPTAERVQRGKTAYRAWSLDQLPKIGESMGYLQIKTKPVVIAVYSLKGGTGKSSLAFQYARTLALHNNKVLVIGLDAQRSITQILEKSKRNLGVMDSDDSDGLYQYLAKGKSLESLIQNTDIPTLDFIGETIELAILDVFLNQQTRKEYILREKVVQPLIKRFGYDVILFDCNPAWNTVVSSALAASDVLISPLGADINSLKASQIFTELLADFQDDMNHNFDTFMIVPTMVEPNKLSQNVQARYRLDYDTLCTVNSIRRAIVVQEANVLGLSLLEYAYDSGAYEDFVGVMREITDAINKARDGVDTVKISPITTKEQISEI